MSIDDPAFVEIAERWLSQRDELLGLVEYWHAAGLKIFYLIRSVEHLKKATVKLPPRARMTLTRSYSLPLRGQVREGFVDEAMKLVPEGSEYLCLGIEAGEPEDAGNFAGTSHVELVEALKTMAGKNIALGPYPPLSLADGALIAYKPDVQGVVDGKGAY